MHPGSSKLMPHFLNANCLQPHLYPGDDDDDDDDDDGYPAYSHHDKIPPWWENVSNDEGGNVSVSKTHHTPYTMMNYILEYM